MTERMIVARRCDMTPPPGSSARFSFTCESITAISPRVVTAPPGPSLPPRVSVTLRSSTKPVPSWRSSRFSKQLCRSVCPVPSSMIGTADSRIGSPIAARAQHDVARDRDRADPRVRPGRAQVGFRRDGHGGVGEQRGDELDAPAGPPADDGGVVALADPAAASFDAAMAEHPAHVEAVARAAAAEELRLHAAAPYPVVAPRGDAALVGEQQPAAVATQLVVDVQAEDARTAGLRDAAGRAAARRRRHVRPAAVGPLRPRPGRARRRRPFGPLVAAGEGRRGQQQDDGEQQDEAGGCGQHCDRVNRYRAAPQSRRPLGWSRPPIGARRRGRSAAAARPRRARVCTSQSRSPAPGCCTLAAARELGPEHGADPRPAREQPAEVGEPAGGARAAPCSSRRARPACRTRRAARAAAARTRATG